MQTIANSRSNQPLNDLAIRNLEFASQDTTLNTNSEVQQLNQINSGNVLANRQAEDEDALLTTIAEQQILANKIQRDALADNLNVMSIRDQYIANSATCWGGDAALFQSYSFCYRISGYMRGNRSNTNMTSRPTGEWTFGWKRFYPKMGSLFCRCAAAEEARHQAKHTSGRSLI